MQKFSIALEEGEICLVHLGYTLLFCWFIGALCGLGTEPHPAKLLVYCNKETESHMHQIEIKGF